MLQFFCPTPCDRLMIDNYRIDKIKTENYLAIIRQPLPTSTK
ncbi:hypothetical protein [Dolichospermum circinale]|nr:hypothetical protein [Dolichospermum circinale]MDB9484814.1 hypothetical protein [Dolichospermum circinale CS-537/05]MDB9455182.1 hypothetical protein [Dolichospermum circinale CS-541/06]MDB9461997.1 hypothetical protein [Dolichospermum circinale CS-541/04]MDB9475798.1 hypothetical protein [Dolichospermum circinale CS-537/11]MDB9479747.1 hypothetical protein [Dolichospermum circinale CS-537/03]